MQNVSEYMLVLTLCLVVLSDDDFLLSSSNFGNFLTVVTIFSHIYTAHAQKQLFMNFR